ncbi:MAG TPA: VOC family protein [Robiginitalea sp.]|nr:VOC family protein [Robiginitalea sp.]
MKSIPFIALGASLLLAAGFTLGRLTGLSSEEPEVVGLSHVGLRVADFDRARDFYVNTLGFKLAYQFDTAEGQPIFAYIQISKNTFLELIPADGQHPAGFDHYGLESTQLKALAAQYKQAGIETADPSVSTFTGIHLCMAKDLDGIRFELIEPVEGSRLRQVIDAWE